MEERSIFYSFEFKFSVKNLNLLFLFTVVSFLVISADYTYVINVSMWEQKQWYQSG